MNLTRSLFSVAVLLTFASSAARGSENNLPIFQADILKKINEVRARHGVPLLKMNPALNQYAEERVNAVSQKSGLSHDGLKQGYGENLFWKWSSGTVMFSGTAAVEEWYGEGKDYKPNDKANEKSGAPAERYTQLVWKNTTEVGCSRATKQETSYYSTYIACVFLPAGNGAGQFATNVLPASALPAKPIKSAKR